MQTPCQPRWRGSGAAKNPHWRRSDGRFEGKMPTFGASPGGMAWIARGRIDCRVCCKLCWNFGQPSSVIGCQMT